KLAVRDSAREERRAQFAEARGGPGYSWTCDCGVINLYTVRSCPQCHRLRPPFVDHVSFEDKDVVGGPEEIEQSAWVSSMLDQIKQRYGAKPAFEAFRLMVLGDAKSAREAAMEAGVSPTTLADYLSRIRRDYPELF